MPPFSAVLAANAANVPKAIVPVAVVVGGTAGIGAGVAEVLAQRTQGRAHIVIVGRNQAAAEAVIAQFPKAVDGGKYEFVQCDITSMRNVGTVARQLSQRLDKINYLVMTAGLMTMAGRQPTEDGLDVKLSIHYYGRFKFARDLAGLLEKAAEKGEPARVMTVLDSLRGGPIWPDDMALERNYSTANAARVGMMYNNAAIVALAQRHPTVSYTHTYPGIVSTNLASNLVLPLRVLANIIYRFAGVSAHDCGENMVYSLFDPALAKGGAYWRDNVGGDVARSKYLTPEMVEQVWEHSTAVCDGK